MSFAGAQLQHHLANSQEKLSSVWLDSLTLFFPLPGTGMPEQIIINNNSPKANIHKPKNTQWKLSTSTSKENPEEEQISCVQTLHTNGSLLSIRNERKTVNKITVNGPNGVVWVCKTVERERAKKNTINFSEYSYKVNNKKAKMKLVTYNKRIKTKLY